ncbi:hypothetical protein [Sphingomonas sp.]|jgi:hypothetical protein|uniref:hypothetical protein n=1 Tax=Sphingomonas sp. TaxID=28214 RepID=UPI002EDB145C
MNPTSLLCRTQQAHHLALADAATLDNSRDVALRAANAWAKEATDAERREKRQEHSRGVTVTPESEDIAGE